jgi:hypothetical protein
MSVRKRENYRPYLINNITFIDPELLRIGQYQYLERFDKAMVNVFKLTTIPNQPYHMDGNTLFLEKKRDKKVVVEFYPAGMRLTSIPGSVL